MSFAPISSTHSSSNMKSSRRFCATNSAPTTSPTSVCGKAWDVFTKLFGNLLAFVYHCFDRIVIHGYLSALSRPEQAAADRLSPDIIRKRLDYWTLILGPKFSAKERKQLNLSRFYAISQIEYCRNFVFKRNFPIHKLFERSCELGMWRLIADKIASIFSTETGDAWLLHPADQLAARLTRDGDPEPIHIEENDTTFAIGWKGRYRVECPAFHLRRSRYRSALNPSLATRRISSNRPILKFQICLVSLTDA
jgi:hypothetical protein